jgi:protein TonB
VGGGGALSSLSSEDFSNMGGGLTDMAFDMSELDKQPVLMASVSPRYPPEMRKNKIEGSVVILFLLNEAGQVEDPRVEKSSRPEFESPALDAVKKWKFKPGQRDGESVRTYMRLPMRFSMSSST